jgi:hypothetical protein
MRLARLVEQLKPAAGNHRQIAEHRHARRRYAVVGLFDRSHEALGAIGNAHRVDQLRHVLRVELLGVGAGPRANRIDCLGHVDERREGGVDLAADLVGGGAADQLAVDDDAVLELILVRLDEREVESAGVADAGGVIFANELGAEFDRSAGDELAIAEDASTRSAARFKHGDVGAAANKRVGAGQPGKACADHDDAHAMCAAIGAFEIAARTSADAAKHWREHCSRRCGGGALEHITPRKAGARRQPATHPIANDRSITLRHAPALSPAV